MINIFKCKRRWFHFEKNFFIYSGVKSYTVHSAILFDCISHSAAEALKDCSKSAKNARTKVEWSFPVGKNQLKVSKIMLEQRPFGLCSNVISLTLIIFCRPGCSRVILTTSIKFLF